MHKKVATLNYLLDLTLKPLRCLSQPPLNTSFTYVGVHLLSLGSAGGTKTTLGDYVLLSSGSSLLMLSGSCSVDEGLKPRRPQFLHTHSQGCTGPEVPPWEFFALRAPAHIFFFCFYTHISTYRKMHIIYTWLNIFSQT